MVRRHAKVVGLLALSLMMTVFLSAFTAYDSRSDMAVVSAMQHLADPEMDIKKFSDQELIKKVPGFKN
ncbi:hypothetical protein [Paenibacillus sp. BC26]|uniref:hypothetical protein n=1 Tax=Paenibacillus sp. BC26 TaxID=1881032 RepID=UPI000B84542C|nr:hypothetical protein [Paenibacillus sp. BC26]